VYLVVVVLALRVKLRSLVEREWLWGGVFPTMPCSSLTSILFGSWSPWPHTSFSKTSLFGSPATSIPRGASRKGLPLASASKGDSHPRISNGHSEPDPVSRARVLRAGEGESEASWEQSSSPSGRGVSIAVDG